jgi:quinoprotein relay system zinc metallohydrolase 2
MLPKSALCKLNCMNLYIWLAFMLGAIVGSYSSAVDCAEFEIVKVAPGVFVHEGRIEPMSRGNFGDIANIGFIVGDDCVAVIDTGGSPEVGAELRDVIKAHTGKSVCYVINTHAHPDHVLGNIAFVAQHPTFIAHKNYAEALGARMQTYLERFSRMYDRKLSPDIIIPPDRTIADTAIVDLGHRVLKLIALPPGHTNNDLIVFDVQTATLWTGDLLFVHHIPVLDGSITGWLADIKQLQNIDSKRAVPGHGPASVPWPQALKAERAYLNAVADGIRAVINRGGTIEEAINTVEYGARRHWRLFDEYHRRNITAAFAELEWE